MVTRVRTKIITQTSGLIHGSSTVEQSTMAHFRPLQTKREQITRNPRLATVGGAAESSTLFLDRLVKFCTDHLRTFQKLYFRV